LVSLKFSSLKRFYYPFFLTFLWILWSNLVECQPIKIPKTPLKTHFQPEDYNGGIQNWDFDQDASNILYVANNDGVLSFDGESWKSYPVPNSTKIRTVLVGHDKKIFVGGQGQIGYFEDLGNGLVFNSLLDKVPKAERGISETWNIVSLNKCIYFSTLESVFFFTQNQFKKIDLPGKPLRIHKAGNNVLVQVNGGGIYLLDGSKLKSLKGTENISIEIMGATQIKNGFLFYGIDGSVYKVVDGKGSLLNTILSDKIINVVLQLKNDQIVVGTQNDGLMIFDTDFNLINQFTKDQGISNRTVIALHEDQFQNLWVGLHNGIDYLELNAPTSTISEQVGLQGTGYASVYWKDNTYLGTNNGLFVNKNGRFDLIKGSEGQVYNLSVVDKDLILNHHRGAFLVNENGVQNIHTSGSWKFMNTPISGLYLAGSYDGIRFFRKENRKWKIENKVTGLEESSRVIEFENDSVIWMTHGYKGAFRITMSKDLKRTLKVDHYGEEDGFPSNTLINVHEIQGALVFTAESGIYDFEEKQNRFIKNEYLTNLMGTMHISQLSSASNGNIYFIQDRKLGRLKKTSLTTFKKETNLFNKVNKFLSDDLESITILDDSNILVGAKSGFIHFNPKNSYYLDKEFKTYIRGIIVSSDSSKNAFTYLPEKLKLNYKQNITISYASPFFDGFENINYSYKLDPINEIWSEWSDSNIKEFDYLPDRNFKFEVKAKNIYGIESEIASFNFSVRKPWYATSNAIIIYLAIGLVVFILFILFQRKRHNTEKEEIEKVSAEVIKEKDQKISTIKEESQQEIDTLKNEKLKTEIAHKNSELTSATTHLLQKNELIQSIKRKLTNAIDRGVSKVELKKILKSIESNLSDDQSWNQFAFHFDQVHGDFLKKLNTEFPNLTPQETKLSAYLRMNLSSKDIAQLLNISVRGVEISRYRLRKKLELARETNLVSFLMDI